MPTTRTARTRHAEAPTWPAGCTICSPMTFVRATREEIAELLEAPDDRTIERILDTGASAAEVAAEMDAIAAARRFGERENVPASERIAALRRVLEDLLPDDEARLYESSLTAD